MVTMTVKVRVAGRDSSHTAKYCSHLRGGLYDGGGGGGGVAFLFANSRSFSEASRSLGLGVAARGADLGGGGGFAGRGAGDGRFGRVGFRGIIREGILGLGGILAVERMA